MRVSVFWVVVGCGAEDPEPPIEEGTTAAVEDHTSEGTASSSSSSSSSEGSSSEGESSSADSTSTSSTTTDTDGSSSESTSSGEALGCEAVCAKAYACGYDSCACNDSFPVECFACWIESTCEQIADYACYDPCN